MHGQNIWTFVKAGILGVVFASLAGVGIVSAARAAMLLLGGAHHENPRHSNRTGQGFRSRQTQCSDGRLGDWRQATLSAIHTALNAKHADGELTDERYAKKARELIVMLDRLGNARFSKTMA